MCKGRLKSIEKKIGYFGYLIVGILMGIFIVNANTTSFLTTVGIVGITIVFVSALLSLYDII